MNHNHSPQDFEQLESPLDAVVAAVLAEQVPQASVRRVKECARMLTGAAVSTPQRDSIGSTTRSLSRTIVGGLIGVAVLAVLAVGISLLHDRGAGSAFAQVVDKVKAADSASFMMTWRSGRETEQHTRMYLEGDQIRAEIDGGLVQIADLTKKRVLYLDTQRKLAQSTMMDAGLTERLANPVDQLRRAKSDDAEAIGEEVLDGNRCSVFRVRHVRLLGVAGDMLMWVDPDSGLPVQFVIHNGKLKNKVEFRIHDFAWNEPLEASLFSLTVPDGFQTGEIVPKPVQPALVDKSSLDAPNVASDGVLSRDRVPSRIVWSIDGAVATALMREPESVSAAGHRLNELRQWDVATGKLHWSVDVAGAGALAATIDRTLLAVATGGDLQLRNAATGEIIHKWETDLFPPQLAFSPDGKSLALAVAMWKSGVKGSGGVQIWDVAHGTVLRSIEDDGPTTFVAYSTDGKYVANSSNSGPVRLWDSTTGELARVFPGTKCEFSPDGRTIACTSMESVGADDLLAKVNLYDIRSAALVKSLASERATKTSWLLGLAFSPKGGLLAAANWDGTVTVWDVASGERKLTISDHIGGVHCAEFSPDGLTLATGSEDKTLRLLKLSAELHDRMSDAN